MVFGSFSLPLLTPALFYALNIIWKRFTNADFFSIAAFTDVNAINSIAQNQPDMVARFLVTTIVMIVFSALIGIWWNSRVWGISALLFWSSFVVFFTTVFTNGGGFFTGLLGSLGYWLSQQEVQRGGQPSYYYLLVTLPMYEILPYLVALVAMFWYWFRHRTARLLIVLGWMLWIIASLHRLAPDSQYNSDDSPSARNLGSTCYRVDRVFVAADIFCNLRFRRSDQFVPNLYLHLGRRCADHFFVGGRKNALAHDALNHPTCLCRWLGNRSIARCRLARFDSRAARSGSRS